MLRLKNKIALITGAAQGIGECIAKTFALQGAKVIVTDINDARGNATAKEIGVAAEYHTLDVADEMAWQTLMAYIQKTYGHLNILVNNAGITGLQLSETPQTIEQTSLATWRRIHHVNLDSVFLGCHTALPLMKSHGGAIVNLSSRSGLVGIPGAIAYASSKAAIRNLTMSIALYCAEQGYPIRCNAVCPAAIMTPMWDDMLGHGESRKTNLTAICRTIPLGHMGEPQDVADAVLYLASDESKYVTGADIHIDGGILAGSASAPSKADE